MSCLKTIVESKNRILITGHINPDGDAIGAGVALLLGLKKSYPDKRVEFVLQDSVPRHIKFLKGTSQIKRLENREIENIQLAFTACPVTIDCPVVIPDVSPYDVLFALHPLKTSVDKVQISFPWLSESEISDRHRRYYHKVGDHYEVKAKYKYQFFKYVQTSLSIWAMNIWIVCDSDEDFANVDYYVQKEKNKRNVNRERALQRKEKSDE